MIQRFISDKTRAYLNQGKLCYRWQGEKKQKGSKGWLINRDWPARVRKHGPYNLRICPSGRGRRTLWLSKWSPSNLKGINQDILTEDRFNGCVEKWATKAGGTRLAEGLAIVGTKSSEANARSSEHNRKDLQGLRRRQDVEMNIRGGIYQSKRKGNR